MFRQPLLFLALFLFFIPTRAQHADLGTGALKNQIWWFNWAGFTVQNGASRTFTTDDGLTVKIDFSGVTAHVPIPYVMNTWSGAVLHLLYDFSDQTIQPALFDVYSTQDFGYTMTITASRNGVPVDFTFITADAEGSDNHERTTLTTSAGNWETVDFFRNSAQTDDPLIGCGTANVILTETYGNASQTGQNPVIATQAHAANPLVVTTFFDHGGTTGGMANAFGIIQAVDRGDLPVSYGTAQHQLLYNAINPCNTTAPLPALVQDKSIFIGSVAGDADPIQYADDNAIGVDEEGISSFPAYDGSGTYSLTFPVNNTSGNNAWLTGWFDYNRNGTFDGGESVTMMIPNNTTTATLTWAGLPAYLPPGTATGYGFRFRISSDLQGTQKATGYAVDGEVEDYFITSATLCRPMTVTVSPATDICPGQPTSLHASGGISYSWSPVLGLDNPAIPDPVASPQTTTTYIVTASDPQACQAANSVTITTRPIPTLNITPATAICPGGSVPISFTTTDLINGYSWSPATGLNDPSVTNPVATPAATTTYTLTATGASGCPATAAVTISVNPQPVVQTRTDTTLCGQPGISLTTSADQQADFQWQPATGLSDPTTASPVATPATSTAYTVTATNQYHCQSTASVNLTVLQLPNTTISSGSTICQGSPVNLQASGGIGYDWTSTNPAFSATGPSITASPAASTEYYARITGSNGCHVTDSVAVTIHMIPTFGAAPADPAICLNDTLRLTASGGTGYNWTTADGQLLGSTSSILVSPSATTQYDVQVSDDICLLSASFTIPVIVRPLPQLTLNSSNTIDCTRGQATITVSGALSYQWQVIPGITALNSANPVVDPLETTTYYVKGTDANGCNSYDSIPIKVDNTEALSKYPVPSAFSPNNDGINDCFGLKYWGHITTLEMAVFNRWGQRVFFTTNPTDCWDGTYNGVPAPAGGYVYQIKAGTACGMAYRKGIVILVR